MKSLTAVLMFAFAVSYSAAAELVADGFSAPTGIAFDSQGNMYVSNWSGGSVIKVSADGRKSIFVSNLGSPSGLAFDKRGTLYVADYKQSIYKVTPDGNKSILTDKLKTPTGISFAKNGSLLVANRSSNEIASISMDGKINIVANVLKTPVGAVETNDGTVYATNYGGGISIIRNGKVSAITDGFSTPGVGITTDEKNNVYAVDYSDGAVKQIMKDGMVTTVADGFKSPVALTYYSGSLYVGTWGDGSIFRINIQ